MAYKPLGYLIPNPVIYTHTHTHTHTHIYIYMGLNYRKESDSMEKKLEIKRNQK